MIDNLKHLILTTYCKIFGHKETCDVESRIFGDQVNIFRCFRCGQVTRIIIKRSGYHDHTTTSD